MKVKYLKNVKKFKPCILAIGVFDGVHKGHLKILDETKKIARVYGLVDCVLTFSPHPLKVLRPQTAPPLITSLEHRLRILKENGIGEIVVAKFTGSFSRKNPRDFIKDTLLKKLNAKWIVVGRDYRFGENETGDRNLLRQMSEELDFGVSLIEPVRIGKHKVSSSRVRKLIKDGALKRVTEYLGRYYSVIGKVTRGKCRGRFLRFPTANLALACPLLLKEGVYAGWVSVGKKKRKAIINIGRRPTFGRGPRTIEVHIFNFNRDIYGRKIEVFFVRRLREEKKFKDRHELIKQLKRDSQKAQEILEKVK